MAGSIESVQPGPDGHAARRFNIQADLRGKEVRYGEQLLEDLSLALTGTRDDHQLRLNARHKEAELSLLLAGDASESWNAWVGALEQGQISVPAQGQQWTLSESAALEYTEAGKLTLGQHCWQWQQASVCAEDQTLLPTQDIAYRIENFPTTALSPLLPDTLRWDATLNADLQLVMTEDGPDGEVSIDAGSGEFEVQVRDEWESLSYNTFTTRLSLKPSVAELDLQLQGPDIGNLSVACRSTRIVMPVKSMGNSASKAWISPWLAYLPGWRLLRESSMARGHCLGR